MNEKEITEKLKQHGYNPVYVWDAKAGEEDPNHTHPFDTHLVILEGEIEIGTDGKIVILKSGDEIDIPKEKVHFGKVGVKGCKYIVGEKH